MKRIAFCLLILATNAMAADSDLPVGVKSVLNVRQLPAETLSLLVADVDSGELLLNWRADEPRNPASTIKLVTTLVALDVLGPAYYWRTDVLVDGEIDEGVLDGDLILKGYGDPFMVTERVWQLLRRIRQAGIKDIRGDLLLDDSWFDIGDYDPAAFDKQPMRAYNVEPNALMMNFKVMRFWFEPDQASGKVKVALDPPLANLQIDNRLGLAAGSCSGFQRGIAINANKTSDVVTLSGRFPSRCDRYAMSRTALSHNQFSYGLFDTLWRESGGTLQGTMRKTVVAEDAEVLFSHRSLPLVDVIARVNKHSNNVMARQLLYTLSAEVKGVPGTEAGGKQVVAEWLAENKIEAPSLALQNGAGLSRDARITANEMADLLQFAWRQPYMPEYLSSMSLSGLDGTLRRRFTDSGLTGKAHLKTGSLDDVNAIAGYLQARSGRRLVVVAMQNHPDIHRGPGEEVQEALLRWAYEQ